MDVDFWDYVHGKFIFITQDDVINVAPNTSNHIELAGDIKAYHGAWSDNALYGYGDPVGNSIVYYGDPSPEIRKPINDTFIAEGLLQQQPFEFKAKMGSMNLHTYGGFEPGENFIFLSVNDDLNVAPSEWEHSDLAEAISLDPNAGHHTYGMGAGYVNATTGDVNFYGYTDGMQGEWPEGKKEEFMRTFVDAGYVTNPKLYKWSKEAAAKNYNQLQYQRWQNQQYPNEAHGLPGDCINPKCDYTFTVDDINHIENYSGWFTCPNCGLSYNYLDESERSYTRAGLTLDEMGKLGENIVDGMGEVPGVGQITQMFGLKTNPIDAIIGPYGVEIKTNHSEAQARFKMGGENVYVPDLGRTVRPKESKEYYCQQNGLIPALLGVRLNFYTDKADIFWREGMTDTWIGNPKLQHVSTVDFSDLNPFKNPADVPTASELPDDDSTPPSNIPF